MSSKPNPNPTPAHTVKEQQQTYDVIERYEIIEGIRYDFQASPAVTHQILVTELYRCIYSTCQLNGLVLVAPMDVYLDEDNIIQPDVIFVSNERLSIVKKQRIEGVPNLLIEILSPSTSKNDKIRKKSVYERFGVDEYWIVDPVHRLIDQYVHQDGGFCLQVTYGEDDTLTSGKISCIHIDINALFQSIRRFEDND